MKSNSQLAPVYEAFEVAQDCFCVASATLATERSADSSDSIDGVKGRSPEEVLDEALKQTEELTVVALWAVFERDLIEYVRSTVKWLSNGRPESYARNLVDKVECEAEFWRVGDILDLFKGEIDTHQIARIKEIKRYRDWIAHRNPRRSVPPAFSPEEVYGHLTELWGRISEAHCVAPETTSRAEVGPFSAGDRDRDAPVPASHVRSPPSTRPRRSVDRPRSDDR
ncbi:RiboL-PSP-HEPN domain-containing protein [Pararobbsia alpina]|uniref:hypothetical protein n=1 Tax=Pararobbsia alpina TaxID=621374 RepID=UPI0039A55ED3